jgi:hypothetical protein
MEEAPAPIGNADLAIGFGCSGDATCPEVLSVSGGGAGRLVTGENVLAVEVHNYNARSPDITFGMALGYTAPIVVRPALRIRSDTGGLALEWDRPGFVVQEAMDAGGPWVDVAGPLETSPARVAVGSGVKFYRLRQK